MGFNSAFKGLNTNRTPTATTITKFKVVEKQAPFLLVSNIIMVINSSRMSPVYVCIASIRTDVGVVRRVHNIAKRDY